MESALRMTVEDGAAVVSLNRPPAFNAVNGDLSKDLAENLVDLGLDQTVRAVIITAEGKAFCAGGDLKAIEASPGA